MFKKFLSTALGSWNACFPRLIEGSLSANATTSPDTLQKEKNACRQTVLTRRPLSNYFHPYEGE